MTANTTDCVFPQQADSFQSACNKKCIYEREFTLSVSLGCLDVSGTVKWNMDYFLGELKILSSRPHSSSHLEQLQGIYKTLSNPHRHDRTPVDNLI